MESILPPKSVRTGWGHGVLLVLSFLNILAVSYCQNPAGYGGDKYKKRNRNNEVSPGLVVGIIVMVCLVALALSMCFLCKRCGGKKQKELRKRKYAMPASRPTSSTSRQFYGLSVSRSSSGMITSRPSSAAVSVVSLPDVTKMARPISDIEVVESVRTPEEHPPSPFAVMDEVT